MLLCDRQLRRWYRELNAKWFDGHLLDVDLLYAPHQGCSGTADQDRVGNIILINPAYALDARTVKLTLLHEMAHISLWPYRWHGEKFQEEMQRLAQLGAFKRIW